jgi:hydroxymethylglutaryl-CoA reductase
MNYNQMNKTSALLQVHNMNMKQPKTALGAGVQHGHRRLHTRGEDMRVSTNQLMLDRNKKSVIEMMRRPTQTVSKNLLRVKSSMPTSLKFEGH